MELANYSNNSPAAQPRPRAAIYARVSSEDQAAEGKVSIQQQLDACARYAVGQGWDVVAQYMEPGVTGETLEERPTLVSLLNDARASKPFDVVICYHSDRLARRGDIYQTLVQTLETRLGIPVAPLNLNLPVDPLRFNPKMDDARKIGHAVAGLFTELDQLARMRRFDAAKRAYVERGKWIASSPPYGYYYTYQGEPTDPKRERAIEVDAVRFRVVQLIFQMLLYRDFSLHKIAKELTALQLTDPESYPSPSKNKSKRQTAEAWYPASVGMLLRNPFYGGRLEYGRTKTKAGDNARKKGRIAKTSLEERTHGWHDIQTPVTPEEWERAQFILNSRGAAIKKSFGNSNDGQAAITLSPRSMNTTNPLSGLLKCAHCGRDNGGTGTTYVLVTQVDYYFKKDEITGERVKVKRYDSYRSTYACGRYRSGDRGHCDAPAPPIIHPGDTLHAVFDLVTNWFGLADSASASASAKNLFITNKPPLPSGGRVGDENNVEARRERLQKKLAEFDKQEKTLDRAMMAEVIDLEKYRELSGTLKKERAQAQADIDRLADVEQEQMRQRFVRERQMQFAQAWHALIEPLYHIPAKGRGKGRRVLKPLAEWDEETAQGIRRGLQAILARIDVHIRRDEETGQKFIELTPYFLS